MKPAIRKLYRAVAGVAMFGLAIAIAPSVWAQSVVDKDVEETTAAAPFSCNESADQFVLDETEDQCGGISVMSGPGWANYVWPGAVNNAYHYLTNYGATPQDGSEYATWSPTITTAGEYEVWVSYRGSENRSSAAPFYVYTDEGVTYKIVINQEATRGLVYAKLGTFYFDEHEASATPTSGFVKTKNENKRSTCIDGAFFKLVSAGSSTKDAPAPGDYDGDGKTDFAVFHRDTATWDVAYTGGGYVLSYPFGATGAIPLSGDYDGDGKADGTVYYPEAGAWYMSFSSGRAPVMGYTYGWSEATPVPGDYDGDGRADLALYYPAAGTWYVTYSSGRSPVLGYPFGWSETTPVPGDYDGDGKADLALYYPEGGAWYLLYSSGKATVLGYHFGWSEATPVAGDYDGDGKADLALYYQEGGTWYLAYSSGKAPVANYVFGWSEAVPAPGDYDGDGKADLAVYHEETQTWYVAYSSGKAPLLGYKIGGTVK